MAKKEETYKLGVIYNGVPILNKLSEARMPATTAFRIHEIINIIQPQIEAFEDTRKKLIERYGKHGEDDTLVQNEDGTVDLEDKDGFYGELQELYDTEVEIKMPKLSVSILDNDIEIMGQPWRPTIQEISLISFMLTDK